MNRSWLLGIALGGAALACTREAKAEGVISVDAHASALFFGGAYGTLGSLGGAIYGGYAFHVSKLYVEPEVSVAADGLPAAPDRLRLNIRATAGARLGLQFVVEPSIYAHIGAGFFRNTSPNVDADLQGTFTLDAGLGLDYRVAKFFTIGLTGGYVGLFGSDNLRRVHGIDVAPRIGFWF